MKGVFTPFFLVTLCGSAPAARGDENHHAAPPLGDRAIGLGGAFTAVSDDPAAVYYNPAGLVLQGPSGLTAGLTMIQRERLLIRNGFSQTRGTADLESKGLRLLPSFAAAVKSWDGFAIAYSSYQSRSDAAYDMLLRDAVTDSVTIESSERSQFHGLSFAALLNDRWSVGGTFYLRVRSESHAELELLSSDGTLDPSTGRFLETNTFARYSKLSTRDFILMSRLGVMYRFRPDLRLGATLQLPAIFLSRKGAFREQTNITDQAVGPNMGTSDLRFFEARAASTDHLPIKLTVGAAFSPTRHVGIAVDVTFVAPLTNGRRLDVFGDRAAYGSVGHFYSNEESSTAIANVAAGVEWQATRWLTVRGGAFTDFSSATSIPELPTEYMTPHIDMYGLATSLGLDFGDFTFTLGASARVGFGKGVGAFGDIEDFSLAYARQNARQDVFIVTITGATQVAKAMGRWALGKDD